MHFNTIPTPKTHPYIWVSPSRSSRRSSSASTPATCAAASARSSASCFSTRIFVLVLMVSAIWYIRNIPFKNPSRFGGIISPFNADTPHRIVVR